MLKLDIKRSFLIVFILIAIAQAAIAWVGLHGIGRSNDELADIYQDRLVPMSQLARINDLMHSSIEQLTIAVIARPSPSNLQKYLDRVSSNLAQIEKLAPQYGQHVATDEDRKLFKEWTTQRETLIAKSINPAVRNLKEQAFNDAEDTVLGVAIKQFAAVQQLFDTIVANELKVADSTRNEADGRYRLARYLLFTALVIAFGLCGGIAFYVDRSISGPLVAMTSAMKRLASGDLEIRVPAADRDDEIGYMAEAVEVFRDGMINACRLEAERKAEQARKEQRQGAIEAHIANFESSVRSALDGLTAAASEMTATSHIMSSTGEATSRQATAAANAAEEASSNVQTVASAAEEMSASVAEISRQVTQSTGIAGQAVHEADATNASVQGLAAAAQKIGDVVKLINAIAEQTNLLALNATIEAARAGEAGKGFAVVASEVKSLASQTGKATEEIAAQVSAMQGATSQVVHAIKQIGGTIGDITKITSTIAAAIEEQSAATQEITRNVLAAARRTEKISSNILGVDKAASHTGAAAAQVLGAAERLGRQAEMLGANVDKFLASIRAA